MATEQLYVVNAPVSFDWHPGRIIRVVNTSRKAQVPGFVLECCDAYSGPTPSNAIIVDAAAVALEQAEAVAPVPAQSYHVREADVPAALGITAAQFETVLNSGLFPAADSVSISGDVGVTGVVYNETSRMRLWRRSDVERFAANARTLAAIFSGKSR